MPASITMLEKELKADIAITYKNFEHIFRLAPLHLPVLEFCRTFKYVNTTATPILVYIPSLFDAELWEIWIQNYSCALSASKLRRD